jgi:flagellar hook-basal body complex protein FliE
MQALRAKNAVQIQPSEGAGISRVQVPSAPSQVAPVESERRVSFASLVGEMVSDVDAKGRTSVAELKKVMTGEVDNLHQSMVAMQEASVAFTLMVEVRNKLMESYQQVMRMQV